MCCCLLKIKYVLWNAVGLQVYEVSILIAELEKNVPLNSGSRIKYFVVNHGLV